MPRFNGVNAYARCPEGMLVEFCDALDPYCYLDSRWEIATDFRIASMALICPLCSSVARPLGVLGPETAEIARRNFLTIPHHLTFPHRMPFSRPFRGGFGR